MAKANMTPEKTPMPSQDPKVRAHNFDEVATGYTEEMAIEEALRCLGCKNMPCVAGCPVNIRIPEFIAKIKECDFEGAYAVISESSSLPAVCGRVCPQEVQCESRCVRGIKGESVGIGRLERFVADWHNEKCNTPPTQPEKNGFKVAVVGSGPSGLTCAGELAKRGYSVTVFVALHTAGGVLVYGIPEFRLPKSIVQKEVDALKAMGVEIVTNVIIGKTVTVDELLDEGYNAVYIASGAGLPNFMGIPGESYKGVYSANEFLTRSNLMKAYLDNPDTPIMKGGRVAVVGGGNVAMDAARTALRLGAEKVYIVYRRSMDELPARREEVEHAEEEGVEFLLLTNPTEIFGYENPENRRDPKNGFVTGMRCIKMELGEPDERGRRSPVPIPDSYFTLELDCVIMSIGTSPNPLIKSTTSGLDVNRRGGIIVEDGTGKTTKDLVWAGGDAVTGAATVISAMGAGKTAARAIDEHLKSKKK
ncbi:MAG: NADPH-dependent glutamate synthase [Clostridia bacterium]|nr:NADPH-dependent glutamate synthase [Clostridia bacterium]